jgi:hypothetical protein
LPQLELSGIAADFQAGNSLQHLLRPMPMLRCPSDVHPPDSPTINYFMNHGSRLSDESSDGRNGFFGLDGPLSDRDVTDGLSHTVMLSEVIHGTPDEPRGKFWVLTDRDYAPGDESVFADDCQAMPQSAGDPYEHLIGGWVHRSGSEYYHLLPPNQRSCRIPGYSYRNSSSSHPGIVHTAYADGSVRATSNSIDRAVWWAAGSRNGGEAVP